MQTYNKPALTFEQQIKLLQNRGLIINNTERAIRHLSNVSYYRLSAYMLPYKVMSQNGVVSDFFITNATWDDIWDLYKFDRKLRLLVFDAIERIEIALRSQITYQLSHKYGSHWQDNKSIFKSTTNSKTGKIYSVYNDIQSHITEQLSASELDSVKSSKLYYFLCTILYLLQTVNPNTKFREHFKDLLKRYPNVNVRYMGFPDDWENNSLWET